jgi:hypothetical protein
VEAYSEARVPATPEALGRLLDVLAAFPGLGGANGTSTSTNTAAASSSSSSAAARDAPGASSSSEGDASDPTAELPSPLREYARLAVEGCRWARKVNAPGAAATLHNRLAEYLWGNLGWKGLGLVTVHYARAANGGALG